MKGFKIGNAHDRQGMTGCTVILCEDGACAGVDVRGGAPATRETDLLDPVNMVERIHAVCLSGGSAYGLEAGSGVMAYLEEKGVGFDVQVAVVPIVCGASLFDLAVGDPTCRPDKKMGYEACQNAERMEPEQGNAGAGTGASVGKFLGTDRMMKSGLGIYAAQTGSLQVGAVVAVNALGDVIDPDTGQALAGLLNEQKTAIQGTLPALYEERDTGKNVFGGNTTIGCIVTNAKLTKAQAKKIASIAHDGYARAIRPVHTMLDGDTIFVMATGEVDVMPDAAGALAAEVMARAVACAVRKAESVCGLPAARDLEK